MKKLSVICAFALVLGLMSVPAFAQSFKFDFYGGTTSYTQGDFEDPQEIDLVVGHSVFVDIWLVDWPAQRPNIVEVGYYFRWHTDSLYVVDVTCNNLKPEGQWDGEYHFLDSAGEYALGVIELDLGVPGPDVLLHTVELICVAPGDDWIKASLTYGGDGGLYGYVVDLGGGGWQDVDDGGGLIHQTPYMPTQYPIATECPEVTTECPAIETVCPEWGDTYCPTLVTVCPKVETVCANEWTYCPEEFTYCPLFFTECPPMGETFCPWLPTICELTMCEYIPTFCPEEPTWCPIHGDFTICPYNYTWCPGDIPTECPMDWTNCPAIPTVCPDLATECPQVATECPVDITNCPVVRTECPDADPTICEVTECPEVYTECPGDFTWCPHDLTACPPGVTWCAAVPTECPMYDKDYDGSYDDCDNCPDTPNGPDYGSCTRGPRAFIGAPCNLPGDNTIECGTNGFCSMAQEDTLPPSGNSSPPTANCGDACECEGDFDNNGVQDGEDAITFKNDFGRFNCVTSPPCKGDFDCNGVVDGADAIQFKIDFGRFDCPNCAKVPWCPYE